MLATAGAGLSGLAGCNFGYLGDTSPNQPPLWGETIRVGVLATSERLPHGKAIEHGAQMVAERINADGGIAGAGLELEVADTEVSPSKARAEHRRLCEEEDCDLTVGGFLGSAVLEVMDSAREQETVHLTTGSMDGRPGKYVAEDYDAFRYHFRPGLPNYGDLGDAVAKFVEANADEFGWERAALVTDNLGAVDEYHDRLATRLPDTLEVPIATRAAGATGFGPTFDHFEEEDCNVAIVGLVLGSTLALRQWTRAERSFDLGGLLTLAMDPGYWAEMNGEVEYAFTVDGLTQRSDNTGRTRGFVDDFSARFGSVPVYSGATTYDALKMYRQAVESIVEPGDTALPDQHAIVEALEELTFTDGLLYDEFAFTGKDASRAHEPIWESMTESNVPVVAQWQADGEGNGSRVAIAPERSRTATYQRPPWIDGRV